MSDRERTKLSIIGGAFMSQKQHRSETEIIEGDTNGAAGWTESGKKQDAGMEDFSNGYGISIRRYSLPLRLRLPLKFAQKAVMQVFLRQLPGLHCVLKPGVAAQIVPLPFELMIRLQSRPVAGLPQTAAHTAR